MRAGVVIAAGVFVLLAPALAQATPVDAQVRAQLGGLRARDHVARGDRPAGQRMAIGATVEPVPPLSLSGCMTNANS